MAQLLLGVALLLLACACLRAQDYPPYVPDNIVPDPLTDCPVANKNYTITEFNPLDLAATIPLLQPGSGHFVNTTCFKLATSALPICATDGTMQIKEGCCSTACAESLAQAADYGCFDQYQQAICAAQASTNITGPIFNAGLRCANHTAFCPTNDTSPPPPAAATTASPPPAVAATQSPPPSSGIDTPRDRSTLAILLQFAVGALLLASL